MLNLFNTILKKKIKPKKINFIENKLKHFPSSTREWNNNTFYFNKMTLKLIPIATNTSIYIIKSFFNLYNIKLERKIRKERLLKRFKRLSLNKIYISNGGFKHTNNNVIITLYLYNRQKQNLLLKIKKEYYKIFKVYNKKLFNKFNLIKIIGINNIVKAYENELIMNLFSKKKINHTNVNIYKYVSHFYKKLLKKSLTRLKWYIYHKQLLYLNKSKYNYTYIQKANKYIKSIFNKNVEFNLINLKHFYLNSDILSESLTLKLTNDRRKLLRFLNMFKNKIKVQKKDFIIQKKDKISISQRQTLNNKLKKRLLIINNLNYRHITGFRLQASGRLTKRFTASRSVNKTVYKGNLMNIDSSYRGLSTVLLKGNLKSNVQYSKLNSKTRIGSFGIKGWISGN